MNYSQNTVSSDTLPADPDVLRAFIALPIPEPVKAEMERVQDELRRVLPPKTVRWTKCEQFHLTLKFLGNVEASRLPELSDAVRRVCSGRPTIRLRAERIGCFPDLRFPRIVWVWVHDEAEQLLVLQSQIEAALARFVEGKTEKKFTGHVTIARINGIKRPHAEAIGQLAQALTKRCFGEWTATELRLMRSELFKTGAIHSVLSAFPLA